MYKHILIPTDGSADRRQSGEAGSSSRARPARSVTLFTAVPEYEVPNEGDGDGAPGDLDRRSTIAARRSKAQEILAAAAQGARAGVDFDTDYAQSNRPYEAIVEAASARLRRDFHVLARPHRAFAPDARQRDQRRAHAHRPPDAGRALKDFQEPLEALQACHGRIEEQLQALERLAHRASPGAAEPAAAQAVLGFFETSGVQHHRDEDEDLFPLLRVRAAALGAHRDRRGDRRARARARDARRAVAAPARGIEQDCRAGARRASTPARSGASPGSIAATWTASRSSCCRSRAKRLGPAERAALGRAHGEAARREVVYLRMLAASCGRASCLCT